jgi:hypothetical protein
VTIAVSDGVLALGGRAAADWIDGARDRAGWIAGVRDVRLGVVAETDAAAMARDRIELLARELRTRSVAFVRDTELAPDGAAALERIAAVAREALSIAGTACLRLEWIAVGTNDEPGGDAINARMREDRARWLAGALRERGVADVRIAADDDAGAQLRQRGAFLRMVPTAAAQ